MMHYYQRSKTTILAIMAISFLILLCISPVSAIGVSGVKYMGSIPPGGTAVHIMTVRSAASENPTDVTIEVMGFGQTLDKLYTGLDPKDDLSPYSARTFITLDNTSIHLEPGTSQNVIATITLPQNVGAGGRYAIIYVHALPGKGASFTTAIVVPVFITVSGTTPTLSGSIAQLDVGDVTIGQPIIVTTTFKNTGNYHYYNTVNQITLTDTGGNVLANVSTPPSMDAIIPGNTVHFVVKPDVNNLPVGTYTVDSKVLLEGGQVLDEKTTTFAVKTNYVPPPTETNMTVSPGSPATLTSPDGRYSVSFPQGAVIGDVVVTLKPYSKAMLSPAPAGATLGASCFEITGLAGLLSKDATVLVKYSADDLAAAGGDASQLKLSYWDAAQGSWVILPTQVDTGSATLTATTNHLSVWAVMVSSSTSGGASAAAEPTKTSLPAVVSLSALIIAVIISCDLSRKRK
jgi:hypothetical protein